jgi:hypothetical protein
MHGLAALALVPTLALISAASYLTLAIIAAIAVIVHEARGLARRLLARQRSGAAVRQLPGAGMPGDASGRDRAGGSPAVPAGAAGASGLLAPSRTSHAALAAVAPPRAPRRDGARPATLGRRARDRQLALACLVVAGLAAAWLVRGSPGRPRPRRSEQGSLNSTPVLKR